MKKVLFKMLSWILKILSVISKSKIFSGLKGKKLRSRLSDIYELTNDLIGLLDETGDLIEKLNDSLEDKKLTGKEIKNLISVAKDLVKKYKDISIVIKDLVK